MKRMLLWIIAVQITIPLHGVVVVQGNDSANAPFAFKSAVNAKTFDRSTGTFYVGLQAETGNMENLYTISKATRPTFNTTPKFASVLQSTSKLIDEVTIEFLAFSLQTATKPILIAVPENISGPHNTTMVTALFNDDSVEKPSDSLKDAAGNTTVGIVNIAANSSNIFAAVAPNSAPWGTIGSGIALIGLSANTTDITLSIKNAPAGVDGNLATPFDSSSLFLKGGAGDVVFTTTSATMVWDDTFQRLFVGVEIETGAGVGDKAKAVAVGRLDNGALTFQEIAPDGGIGPLNNQVAVAMGSSQPIAVRHLQVMHVSTGPDYLILDNIRTTTTSIRIFAAPLVNDTSNPTSATNGTFANKKSMLDATTFKFTEPVSMNMTDQIPINDAFTDPAAVVGAGDLPITSDDNISDLIVVGDGVYVSIDDNDGSSVVDSDRGVFYSQAMFDNTGKILRWTPWTKRGVPFNAFPGITLPGGSTHNGIINFLEVDGKTGNIWIVEGTTGKTVGITNWSKGTSATGLISTVAAALSRSSYSVLDLDQATRGFLRTTAQRYALFGGVNRVAFARISEAIDPSEGGADQTYSSSPQTSITDFSSEENFLITDFPSNSGCCQVLEYSRTSTAAGDPNDLNYFFAGTENGLFVFTNTNGEGFNAGDLDLLNDTLFTSRSWQKMESITGSVIDIKTSGAGKRLYVLTFESTATEPLKSTLYSIPFATTTAAMFAPGNIRTIAQTGVGVFSKIFQFYGIQVIATGNPKTPVAENKEQVVLATNQGLYRSAASQIADPSTGLPDATNQATADWMLVVDMPNNLTTATTMFNGIAGPDTPIRQTSWPFSIVDTNNFGTFDRGTINQFSGNGNDGGSLALFNVFFLPNNFNANSTSQQFFTLDRINYFHSDGGRRFFLLNRTTNPPNQIKVSVLPYNVSVWNIAQPGILSNPTLESINQFYWIKQIGASGILMAGVGPNVGVIGLE